MILRIHKSKSAKETTHYFIGKQSQEIYYSRDNQEFAGYWGGKGAQRLGLHGKVTDEAFARLVNNLHPITGKQLTPRMREDRRPGFDLNFNVPKSVSLAWAWTRDERIIRALRQAQLDTLLEMQEEAATRVRVNGQDYDRKTGVLLWAEYIHLTARPENGIPDPHLHSHCYVMNVTWDRAEKKWKALQMGLIWDDADYYNWMVTHRLAKNLKTLGFEIVPTKDAFEIAGISRELVMKFSRRTKTIEAEARKRGITDPAEKAQLAAMTRRGKSKSLLLSEIEPYWWGNLLPEERAALDRVKATLERSRANEYSRELAGDRAQKGVKVLATPGATKEALGQKDEAWVQARIKPGRTSLNKATRPSPSMPQEVNVTDADRRAVALGREHLFERRSVVSEKQLKAEALKSFCVGRATPEGIAKVVEDAPLVRRVKNGRVMVTTAEILAEEKRILKACLDGKGKCEPVNEFWKIRDEELTDEQKNAVFHVLNSRDLITGISGNPGVGKTRILQEVKRGVEAGCYKIIALAPWGVTAHEVLRKDGFENAETIAKLLTNGEFQEKARGAVWLVDEAGLLSTREAERLIALAKELGARLVLVGDVGQHHAVERGQAFDLLIEHGGLEAAEVLEIQRQKGAYKFYVQSLLKGDVEHAFKLLDRMEAIEEMTFEERKIALAGHYVAAIERGETALVVAPTHAECKEVTEGIRAALKEKGILKRSVEWDVLPTLSWTKAQRSDCDQYTKGLVVKFNGHVKGFALGELVEVVDVRDGMVRVRSTGRLQDAIKALPLHEAEAFSVHERAKIELCEGDLVHFTANGRSKDRHRLSNGSCQTIEYISPEGDLVLENGHRIGRDFKHLEYGYVLTSHAAQGKTVDRVLLAQSPELSSGASDLTQWLVSTTRARKGLHIITTDIETLKEDVSRVRKRMMATELLQGEAEEKRCEPELARSAGQLGQATEAAAGKVLELAQAAEMVRAKEREPEQKEVLAQEQELQEALELEKKQVLEMGMGMGF